MQFIFLFYLYQFLSSFVLLKNPSHWIQAHFCTPALCPWCLNLLWLSRPYLIISTHYGVCALIEYSFGFAFYDSGSELGLLNLFFRPTAHTWSSITSCLNFSVETRLSFWSMIVIRYTLSSSVFSSSKLSMVASLIASIFEANLLLLLRIPILFSTSVSESGSFPLTNSISSAYYWLVRFLSILDLTIFFSLAFSIIAFILLYRSSFFFFIILSLRSLMNSLIAYVIIKHTLNKNMKMI